VTEPNVLLVVLDSVRARNTPLYGYSRATTPHLAAFADRSTHYKHAWTPGIGSTQSHASIYTGLQVVAHGLNCADGYLTAETIWDELNERGYETGSSPTIRT